MGNSYKIRSVFAIAVIAGLVTFGISTPPTARVLDPGSTPDAVLSALVDDLDAEGIDVRYGSNRVSAASARPSLMPLKEFKSTAGSRIGESVFASLFAEGVREESALLAIDDGTGEVYENTEMFSRSWENVDQSKRVFISFTSTDIDYANRVEKVLNSKGYATFIYLGGDDNGQFNAVDTGNYFREAGTRLVIDTNNARNSRAIAVEAMVASGLVPPSPTPTPRPPDLRSSVLCCKLCTYRNGVQIGCGQVECGPQCRDARGAPAFGETMGLPSNLRPQLSVRP